MCLFQRHGIQQHDTKTFIKKKEAREEEEEDHNVSSVLLSGEITVMRRIMTFRSTTDRIYDGGPIRLYYNNTYHCVTIAYSIQYSNMLYRFVA